jgi:hypothetical protein
MYNNRVDQGAPCVAHVAQSVSQHMEGLDPTKVVCATVMATHQCGKESQTPKGTKHFRANAKVFVIDAYWGTCDTVTVIGHHRAGGRYAKLDMPIKHLEDFRMGVAYSPTVLELLKEHFKDRNEYSEDYAEELLRALPQWKDL